MQNMIIKCGRFAFMSILAVVMLSTVFVEVKALYDYRTDNKLMTPVTVSDLSTKVRLAMAENNGLGDAEMSIDGKVIGADARQIIIKKYLEKYKSPLVPYAELIFSLSQTYGYDYRYIVAIAQQESNLCKKIPEGSYNCWGYGIHKLGTLGFDNYEIALKSFGEYLDREYFKKGYTTPELMMKKYCPSSNGSWAFGVNQFMDEMATGKF